MQTNRVVKNHWKTAVLALTLAVSGSALAEPLPSAQRFLSDIRSP